MLKGMGTVLGNLDRWYAEKMAGCEAVGRNIAAKAEGKAKRDRPWTDRSHDARDELHAGTQWDSPTALIIYLAHGVEYGPYLELAHDKKYEIIEKTLNSFRKELLNYVKMIMNS